MMLKRVPWITAIKKEQGEAEWLSSDSGGYLTTAHKEYRNISLLFILQQLLNFESLHFCSYTNIIA